MNATKTPGNSRKPAKKPKGRPKAEPTVETRPGIPLLEAPIGHGKSVALEAQFSSSSAWNFWWKVFSAALGAGTVISLAQRAFSVGLAPVFADFVSFYRGLFHPLVEAMLSLVPFDVAPWYPDAFLFSFLFLSSTFRLHVISSQNKPDFAPLTRAQNLVGAVLMPVIGGALAALLSIPLLGIILFVAAVSFSLPWVRIDEGDRENAEIMRQSLKWFWIMCCAALAFFALNAQFA